MGNKLSSTNIAELLKQHLKTITEVNDVIVKSNISADVVANINDNIKPISEALKSLDTISEVLSSSKINVIGNIKYNYGIKTIVNNLNELLTSFNEIPIDNSKLDKFKKAIKPINEVIEAITSVSDKMSKMKIGSIFGNVKFSVAIKGIIENIKNVIEQIKAVNIDKINDEYFKSLSSVISNIIKLTNDLVKIGTIAPLLVALSPSIILAVKIIISINLQLALIGKKGVLGALHAAIIGRALAEFAKGVLVFLVASLGGIVFILGVVALLAMKVFMHVFFLLFNRKQMKDILIATIVIMSMAKAIMLISMVVILWALTGQLVIEEWKNILVMMGFVMLAVVVFVLFGLLSQFIKLGNRTMHKLALTLILLSLTVVLWALTGELIVEQQKNIFMVIKFVIFALILFTTIGLLGKIIKTGAGDLLLMSLVLVILSLTVLLWAGTGEYITSKWKEILVVSGFVLISIGLFALLALVGNIFKNGAKSLLVLSLTLIVLSLTILLWSCIGGIMMEKWKEILVVSGFVLIAIGLFALLALAGNIFKNGTKSVFLMVLALALISVVILLWAFIGEMTINDYESILAVMGFIALASVMMFILAKIYKHVIKGMKVAILISATLFILVIVAALSVIVGKMMLENWGGVLILAGFIVVIIGIFAILGIPAVFAYVYLGAIVMRMICSALLLFSVSMLIFVLAIKLFEFDDVFKMMALIGGLGTAIAALGLIMPLILLGTIAMIAMGGALMVFVVPLLIFTAVLSLLKKINATEEDVKKPIHLMGSVIDAINEEFGDEGIASIALAAAKILLLVPVALAIGVIAKTLQDIASLAIPTGFDAEGKATGYNKMKAEDFALAAQNAIGMLKIMASVFGDGIENVEILGKPISIVPLTTKELDGITNKTKRKIRQLSKITSFIGDIAETIQNIASLRVPKAFDEQGKPTGYIHMEEKHFTSAAENVVKIISTLINTISSENITTTIKSLSKKSLKNISVLLSSLGNIKNVVDAIQSLAEMRFPVKFDNNGNPTEWRALTDTETESAKTNLTSLLKDVLLALCSEELTSTLNDMSVKARNNFETIMGSISGVNDLVDTVIKIGSSDKITDSTKTNLTDTLKDILLALSSEELTATLNAMSAKARENFETVMGSISGVNDLVDAVVKIGSTDKNITIKDGIANLKTVINDYAGVFTKDNTNSNLNKIDDGLVDKFNDLFSIQEKVNKIDSKKVSDTNNSFVKFIDKANSIDTDKIKTVKDMFAEMAELSKSLKGDFDKLADVLSDKLVVVLEKLQETISGIPTNVSVSQNTVSQNTVSQNTVSKNNSTNTLVPSAQPKQQTPVNTVQPQNNDKINKNLVDIKDSIDDMIALLTSVKNNTENYRGY